MRRIILLLLFFTLPSIVIGAKYAGEPFSIGVGSRTLAMGGAGVAGPFDGSAGYWNPAGMNYLSGHNLFAMHAETFGSLLNQDFVSYIYSPKDSNAFFHSYGFYIYYLGGSGIKVTDIDPSTGRPYVVREESHADVLLAGSVSKKIAMFDLGVTARLIYRDIVAAKGYGVTVDAGALYQPVPYARLGLVFTDLTSGYIHYDNGTSESIYPAVKPGLSVWRTFSDFTGRLSVSGDIRFEGIRNAAQYWMGNISMDTHYGAEVSYRELLFGRFGFDIGDFTAGLGLAINKARFDFAWLHNSLLDETFRVSAGYQF